MQAEIESKKPELNELAKSLASTFIQRWDLYAKQLDDGRYICVREPLDESLIVAHLEGQITLGAYVLDQNSQARYLVIDADDDQSMSELADIGGWLADEDMPVYLEKSRRGGHLWVFFESPLPGVDVRSFGAGLLAYHDLADIELFPKQDRLNSGPGSLIRLPFGIHRKSGRRYGFFLSDRLPLAPTLREQIRLLAEPGTVSRPFFDWFRDYAVEGEADLYCQGVSEDYPMLPEVDVDAPVSERIKGAVRVRPFVEKYVQLSHSGTGSCPFHDDKVASFSVNEEENYWHCFACGTGGSIIDFWMQRHKCDFTTAVTELADILL
jgi:hypothetical protein